MNFLADVQKARVATILIFREAAEMELSVGEAVISARKYLKLRGYPVPDDPLAFATGRRCTMLDAPMNSQFYCKPNGEIL